jgi:transcription elongation factor
MSDSTSANGTPTARRGVIDQFEGDLAVIVFDDNAQLVVPRATLPANARAGDVVTVNTPAPKPGMASAQAATPSIEVNADETAASKERVRNLLDDIFKK